MKKNIFILLVLLLQFNSVSAGTAGITGQHNFTGVMSMYDPGFGYAGSSTFEAYMDFNGAGSEINSTSLFYGYSWSLHDISITDNGNGTYSSQMLFDWGTRYDIPVEFLFDIDYVIDEFEMGQISLRTLTGNGDGVPGYPMESDAFMGISMSLNTNPVPVPAAVWLFGSGLMLMLTGLRKK